ncbi:MAG: hypothetical protein KAJ28_11190 [Flavobacteriaceae bacterium]|nr:hypothetical protein [Flavobacteriaceae bacterium]
MKTVKTSAKYVEWLNAEVMHEASKKWLSELSFINDEQHFFENLIKSYTLQLIDSQNFSKSKEIIENLNTLQKENNAFIEAIKIHENKLQIMVDEKFQYKEEKVYKNEHRKLIVNVSKYLKEYRELKRRLFEIIKFVMKKEKQKYLLK